MKSAPPDQRHVQHDHDDDDHNDDEWLRALVRAARAAEAGGVPAADSAAVFAPLGPAFEANLVQRGLAHVAAGAPAGRTADVVSIFDRVSPARPRAAPAPAPSSSTRRAVLAAATGVLAVAAAVALWPRVQAVPGFALEVQAEDSVHRGARAGANHAGVGALSLDSRLELRLRPAHIVDGSLAAALLVRLAGGAWHAIPVTPEMAPTGAVRWRGTPRAWFGPHVGAVEIVMIVGRAAAVARAARTPDQTASRPGPGGDVFVARASFAVTGPGASQGTDPATTPAVPAPVR